MWNLSLIKQQGGKLLEVDRVFYRTKCSNFQHISQSIFFVSSFPFIRVWLFFFFPVSSVILALAKNSEPLGFLSWPPSDSIIIVPETVIRTRDDCMTSLPRGGTFTCPREFVLLQWTWPRMTSKQSWLLPGSVEFLNRRKKRKVFFLK